MRMDKIVSGLLSICFICGWMTEGVNGKRPNIIIFMSDDQDMLLGKFAVTYRTGTKIELCT